MTGEALGPTLLALARNAIGRRFGIEPDDIHELPEHQQAAATFVTLTRDGQLRGCIGSLEAFRGLADDVTENALAAAFCVVLIGAGLLPMLGLSRFVRGRLPVASMTRGTWALLPFLGMALNAGWFWQPNSDQL